MSATEEALPEAGSASSAGSAAATGRDVHVARADGRLSALTVRPAVYGQRQREAWLLAVVIAGAVPVFVHGLYGLNIATNMGLYAILAVGFFFQFALAGQFSFATPTFYAIGAYTSIWAEKHGGFVVGFVAAVLATALVGMTIKLILARSPLIHFAIATLAVGQLGIILLRNWHAFTNGDQGIFNIPPAKIAGITFDTPTKQYLLVAGVLMIGTALAILYERSPAQRDIVFVRDMGPVARTVGLRTIRLQTVAFGVGAAYMGAAGSLFAHTGGFITITGFDTTIALLVLVMVLVGGIANVWGPVLGAIALYELQNQALQRWLNYQDLIYAVLILAVILILPGGLVSVPTRIRGLLRRRPA